MEEERIGRGGGNFMDEELGINVVESLGKYEDKRKI